MCSTGIGVEDCVDVESDSGVGSRTGQLDLDSKLADGSENCS